MIDFSCCKTVMYIFVPLKRLRKKKAKNPCDKAENLDKTYSKTCQIKKLIVFANNDITTKFKPY